MSTKNLQVKTADNSSKELDEYLHPKFNAAMDYILETLTNISLQSAADHIGLHLIILEIVVENIVKRFTDTLNRIRIEKAKELLCNLKLPVYIIAKRVGLNATYFIRVFKRIIGCTPGEYRMRGMPDG